MLYIKWVQWKWVKTINHNFKGLYKMTCDKANSTFSQYFYTYWALRVWPFFLFPYKSVCKILKIDKISSSAFIICENEQNLKTLIEIFCQNCIDLNVIFAFLDHLKLKIYSLASHGDHQRTPSFSTSVHPPLKMLNILYCIPM